MIKTRAKRKSKYTVLERFFQKVVKEVDGCWNWTASTYGKYGQFNPGEGITSSHRFSWMHHNGEIPQGLFVLHKCDNPICVNPNHLFLGTHQDNMDDMMNKGRGLTGRPMTEETKTRLLAVLIGNKNCLGRKLSDETKAKISKSCAGRKAWNKGLTKDTYT